MKMMLIPPEPSNHQIINQSINDQTTAISHSQSVFILHYIIYLLPYNIYLLPYNIYHLSITLQYLLYYIIYLLPYDIDNIN